MTTREQLRAAVGFWSGTNRLWMTPEDAATESESRATVSLHAQDQLLMIEYSWAADDVPHDGVLLLPMRDEAGSPESIWIDSFHTQGAFMRLQSDGAGEGHGGPDGPMRLLGTYAAGDGPNWGWRVDLSMPSHDSFTMEMFNITPEGEEMLAVRARYEREAEQ